MKLATYASLIFSLFPILTSVIESTNSEERIMDEAKSQTPQIPPEVAAYLKEAPPESKQFDFLIGNWDVAATRYNAEGTVLVQYKGSWQAQYLNDGRMIIDDFKALAPNGQAVSSIVTLRTYSEVTHRWEMSGLAARQPAWNAEWYGEWKDGEMLLNAIGSNPAGIMTVNKIRFFDIAKDSFKWESKVSTDSGKTWTQSATLIATKATR